MRNLIFIFALLATIAFSGQALADSVPATPTSLANETLDPMQDYLSTLDIYCGIEMIPTTPNQDLKFISLIVHCFENVIDKVAIDSINALSDGLRDAVNAAMVIFLIIFGLRLVTGSINNPRQEVIISALKIAFVAWAINSPGITGVVQLWYMTVGLYESMLGIMITPTNLASCQNSMIVISLDIIWDTMDCLFGKIIGYNATNGYGTSWQGVALLFSTLVAKASQGGGAYLVGAFIANAILTIIFSFLQICMAYIISMLGLMLLFSLAPLTLPMMFFKQTYSYFEAWYRMIISFILQVTILFAFTSFAFGIMEQIYSGPDGLEETFSETKVSNEVTRTDTLGTNTVYWQKFETMFNDTLAGKGDMNMIVNFVSLLVLGYLMLSFIGIVGQIAHEISGSSAFPNLMSSSGSGMNFALPKV